MSLSSKMLKQIDEMSFSSGGAILSKDGSGTLQIKNSGSGGFLIEDSSSDKLIFTKSGSSGDFNIENLSTGILNITSKNSGIYILRDEFSSNDFISLENRNGLTSIFSTNPSNTDSSGMLCNLSEVSFYALGGLTSGLNIVNITPLRFQTFSPIVVGALQPGDTPTNGMIRLNGSNIEFRSGDSWVSPSSGISNSNNYLSRYKSAITETSASATWVDVAFDSSFITGSNYTNTSNTSFTLRSSGYYDITYNVGVRTTNNSNGLVASQLLLNGVLLPGSLSYNEVVNSSTRGYYTLTNRVIRQFSENDIIRVQFRRDNGAASLATLINACNIQIIKLSN